MIFPVNKLLNVKAFYNKQFSHNGSSMVFSDSVSKAGVFLLKVTGNEEGREEGWRMWKCGPASWCVTCPDICVCRCVCVKRERYLLKTWMLKCHAKVFVRKGQCHSMLLSSWLSWAVNCAHCTKKYSEVASPRKAFNSALSQHRRVCLSWSLNNHEAVFAQAGFLWLRTRPFFQIQSFSSRFLCLSPIRE